MKRKWSMIQLQSHIKKNTTEKAGTYSAAVVIAALHRKLYGELPRIGLSGAQAEFAESIKDRLPEPNPNAKYM